MHDNPSITLDTYSHGTHAGEGCGLWRKHLGSLRQPVVAVRLQQKGPGSKTGALLQEKGVDLTRLELVTSAMRRQRSPS